MKYLDQYANLILEAGIALQEGQNITIQTEPCHADFALLLERIAYGKGAKLVNVELTSPRSNLSRSNFSKKEYLDYQPAFWEQKMKEYAAEGWSSVFIGGPEDLNALKDLNQENYSVIHRAFMPLIKDLMVARSNGTCRWTVCNMPTPAWAKSIWPDESGDRSDAEMTERLWETLVPILRLDRDDPVAAWQDQSRSIHKRAGFLNDLQPDHLHFKGPGTDLKVFLTPYSKFIGGAQNGRQGEQYIPNLPTEEFFTTPDYRRTEGIAKVTRPVNVMGVNVEGAWFRFREGAVVDYGADEHKDRLDAYFKLDEKARYLGEVALVDCSSPIYRSELVFNDILYDENAACHIALGRGYSMAMPDKRELSQEALDELGCNNCTLHTDFMIGSEELDVTAVTGNGERVEVIRKGYFVI